MNESSCYSPFQTELRRALLGCEVIKHADKSMIGMVDASVTCEKKTLWMEYKFIGPETKGVKAAFMNRGEWSPLEVAQASPTQFDTAKRLAQVGHCIYLFWVLDPLALRKKIKCVVMWHPVTGKSLLLEDTHEAVFRVSQFFKPGQSVVPKAFAEFFTLL